jgi:hypothetical protein
VRWTSWHSSSSLTTATPLIRVERLPSNCVWAGLVWWRAWPRPDSPHRADREPGTKMQRRGWETGWVVKDAVARPQQGADRRRIIRLNLEQNTLVKIITVTGEHVKLKLEAVCFRRSSLCHGRMR